MTEADDLATLQRAFPLMNCPQCGYSRTGLAQDQLCPECGWVPTSPLLVFYCDGVAGVTTFDGRNLLFGGWLTAGMFFVMHVGDRVVPPVSGLPPWVVTLGLLMLLGTAIEIFRRRLKKETGAGMYQIRLSPEGFATRIGFGQVTVRAWRKRVVSRIHVSMLERTWLQIGTVIPVIRMIYNYHVQIRLEQPSDVVRALDRQLERWQQRSRSRTDVHVT